MKIKFDKHDQPLYEWKLESDGSIKEFEPIYEYNDAPGVYRYSFAHGTTYIRLKAADLDKFIHGRYYSFSNDKYAAVAAMSEYLVNKVIKAEEELKKAQEAREAFISKNMM